MHMILFVVVFFISVTSSKGRANSDFPRRHSKVIRCQAAKSSSFHSLKNAVAAKLSSDQIFQR